MNDMKLLDLRERLSTAFGTEWFALSRDDQQLIIRDCMEDGGVSNIRQYQRNIGTGNLQRYVDVMRVRFNKESR